MNEKMYTYNEYMKKYKLKSRTSIYNKIKKGDLIKVDIDGVIYLKENVHNVQDVYTAEHTENTKQTNENVQSVHTNESVHTVHSEQTVQLKHKIELLETELKGKDALISRLETELKNLQIQVHTLLQANVQMSVQSISPPKKKGLFARIFKGKEKE